MHLIYKVLFIEQPKDISKYPPELPMATLVSIVRILSKMTCGHFCSEFDIF